jgi:RsiW-degrading membrane proteinase PrsW (M82 family)
MLYMSGSWFLIVLILISSLPVVAVYIWFRIAKYQISLVQFLFALLAGAAAVFPALILRGLLTFSSLSYGRIAVFYNFFIKIAFTEELSRLIMLFIFFFIVLRFKPNTDSTQSSAFNIVKQGTAIGLVAGLGFAILESATYIASDMSVIFVLLRLLTAVLHGACSSRVGSAVVMFREKPIQALMRFFTAVAIHGVYDLMVRIPGLLSILAILIAFSAITTTILSIRSGWESVGISVDNPDENQ